MNKQNKNQTDILFSGSDPEEKIHSRMVLVGQPNSGKSTIYNEVAGYKSVASNFPGATISYTQGHVNIAGETFDIVDLPGIYSLTSLDPAATETQRFLLTRQVDMIINVLDASILSRSLELTLQLMDLEIPMVLCLNMTDEAERKGIRIDIKKLSDELGIPVVTTVASQGRGVDDLFKTALNALKKPKKAKHIPGNRDVEEVLEGLIQKISDKAQNRLQISRHLLATKLLEADSYFLDMVDRGFPEIQSDLEEAAQTLAYTHGKPAHEVINAERHALCMSLFEKVATLHKPHVQFKDRVDDILMHPFLGYLSLGLILFIFFSLVFAFGGKLEAPILDIFEKFKEFASAPLPESSLASILLKSMIDGLAGGVAIVLPYLLPFLMGLSILEDIGYLPRVAFLMDAFMHRIGLHGTAVIPAVLGYGCNVPAVLATQVLASPRDRFIAAMVSTMVPCAARMTIIFGLVGAIFGGSAAFAVYGLNLFVIAVSGAILSRLLPEDTPGMLLSIPVYQFPRPASVLKKTWFRIKEFVVIALPFLVAGSLILTLAEVYSLNGWINHLLRPVTWLLGLPSEVGLTLIFGVFRKELSMVMLFQALGTRDVAAVLSSGQIWVFTVFVVFYVPCVATIAALGKQIGSRATLKVVGFTFFLALLLGIAVRVIASVLS